MNVHEHLILTAIIGIVSLVWLDEFSGMALGIMLATTAIIDTDHIINYFMLGKPITFKAFYKHHMYHYKNKKERFYIFHTLEFQLFLLYMATKSWTWFLIFYSAVLHLLTDQTIYYLHHRSLKQMRPWISVWHVRENIKNRIRQKVRRYEDVKEKTKKKYEENVLKRKTSGRTAQKR